MTNEKCWIIDALGDFLYLYPSNGKPYKVASMGSIARLCLEVITEQYKNFPIAIRAETPYGELCRVLFYVVPEKYWWKQIVSGDVREN